MKKVKETSTQQQVINVNLQGKNEPKGMQKHLTVFKDAFHFVTEASAKSLIKFFIIVVSVILLAVAGKLLYSAASSDRIVEIISDRIV